MYTPKTSIDPNAVPTRETYDALQHAYDHFNWTLFESELPHCLITLQRKGRTFGYFCRERFARADGARCDEIALNPTYLKTRSLEDSLSTLVHEMVHLWQFHFGVPGRGRYHNRQWAEKMRALGLYPSNTGKPGGAELGDQMSHYIMDEGAFARSASELISSSFKLEWRDHVPLPMHSGTMILGAPDSGTITEPVGGATEPALSKAGKRVKYTCPACGLNAWARHEALLICGEDSLPLAAQ